MGGGGDAMKDVIELNVIADALTCKITEMVRGKEPEHGSITFTFSPSSDTLGRNVEIKNHMSLKDFRIK
jgi:hypothetical protein